jgi:hypothetical protein
MTLRFFKLCAPDYPTDAIERAFNPVTAVAALRVPGVACPVCGPWSSSRRLRVPIPRDVSEFQGIRFLPLDDWTQMRTRWADQLGVEASSIEPGAEIGPPAGTCTASITEEAVHPSPGQIWLSQRVRLAFERASMRGVGFAAVHLDAGCSSTPMYELTVEGRCWRVGSTQKSVTACDSCGRRSYLNPGSHDVDATRWDGSDFFFLDSNPNIVFVSERVAAVVAEVRVSNLVARRLSLRAL